MREKERRRGIYTERNKKINIPWTEEELVVLKAIVARDGPGNWHGKAAEMGALHETCQVRTANSVEAQYYKCVVHGQPLRKGGNLYDEK